MNGFHPLLPADTPDTAAAYLLSQTGGGSFVVTLNFELIARALSDPAFANLIHAADGRICDGIGGKMLLSLSRPQTKIPRIPGIDLGLSVLRHAAQEGKSVFFLGAQEKIADKAARRLQTELPALQIAGTYHGYFGKADLPALRGMIHESGAEIVIVCLGSPAQEQWIAQNRRYLPRVRLFLPLGGSLDVWAGQVPRAPRLLQALGLEWIFRIAGRPRRALRLGRAALLLLASLLSH